MPYRRRTFVRRSAQRNRRWLWIRSAANSVTPIPDASFESVDLLSNYRLLAGIDLNLPEFTIWRIRFKVSVRITPVLSAGHVDSNSAVTIALFCDNMVGTYTNPVVAGFDERYLLWDRLFTYKTLSNSTGVANFAAPEDIALYGEYDMKGHRRLGNIGETLLFQIAAGGLTIANYSYQQNTLVLTK